MVRTVSEDFPDVEPVRSTRGRGRGRGRGGGRGRGARRKREDDEAEMFNPEEGRGKRRKRGAFGRGRGTTLLSVISCSCPHHSISGCFLVKPVQHIRSDRQFMIHRSNRWAALMINVHTNSCNLCLMHMLSWPCNAPCQTK